MNTIKALVPYQTETFRPHPVHARSSRGPDEHGAQTATERSENGGKFTRLPRSTPFLVQLMVSSDSDLRKNLGRQEIIQARETAYGAAMANRPSAGALRFVQVLGKV
ncbi:MAG: hypothetical protein ACRCS0_07680 [Albidovulum sp.]